MGRVRGGDANNEGVLERSVRDESFPRTYPKPPMKKILAICAAAALSFGLSARAAQAQDIVDVAAGNPDFSTLVAAVKAAGLVDTLKGSGPFTVFAPTNAAFAKIPKAKLDALLKDKAALTKVLTYHVIPGKVMAADVVKLKNGTKVKTVQGSTITVKVKPGVMVNNARVIKTDVGASNGVIHVIDTVILPPMGK
jgi:uncharacterized surface protein with fasciclin (FAS1) repeats